MRTVLLTILAASFLALPLPAQYYDLHNGTFDALFAIDTDNNDSLDTFGVPASWSSHAGILFGRDYNPDGLVEGLVKLIDNRRAHGHWTLGYASVTTRDAGVQIRNLDSGDEWILVTTMVPRVGLVWGAAPNGITTFMEIGYGGTISIQHAFDANGFIPRKHFRRGRSAETEETKLDAKIQRELASRIEASPEVLQ